SGLVVVADLKSNVADLKTTFNEDNFYPDNIEKLRFVLNRPITCLHADEEVILKVIERGYQNLP
ncbi:MAG: hypothetical protein MUC83_04840, partial [Pirellula sp.]|nr:hypothetical protein [Pirellula sp.]